MNNLERTMDLRGWDLSAWKKFFVVAGLWNFSFVLAAFLMPVFFIRLMYGIHTDNFYIIYLNLAFFVAVALFGIAYFMIAIDPPANTNLVILGIIGKTAVAFTFYYLFAIGRISFLAILAGTGDLLFALYFLHYLVKGPREQTPSQQ